VERFRKMTDKHTKEEIKHSKELGDIIENFCDHIDISYDTYTQFIVKCIWCGEYIENKNNIVLHDHDIYHLKCMIKVYETEKENRDL